MSLTFSRWLITLTTLGTAGIHFYLIPGAGVMFLLNGLGYLALLAALLAPVPAVRARVAPFFTQLHWAYIGYTAITILGWVAIGDKSFDTFLGQIGYLNKAIELALVAGLLWHLRQTRTTA